MLHRAAILITSLVLFFTTAVLIPSVTQAASCGSGHIESHCPPYSQYKPKYPDNYTFLNLGNAESNAFSASLRHAAATYPGWVVNGLTGTTWTYRRSSNNVVAVIWLFDYTNRIACRYAWDVYGTNGHFRNIEGSVNWCQYY